MTVVVAWLVLAMVFVHPPHGTGVNVCVLRTATGVPCPGCGLTRSLSCAARGMIHDSLHYHPMGIVVLTVLVASATVSLLPSTHRVRIAEAIERRAGLANTLYFALVAAFIGHGVVRAAAHLPELFEPPFAP